MGELEDLQKQGLKQLNERALIYGEKSLTEKELTKFENGMAQQDQVNQVNGYRERIKEMMLMDSESATKLRDAYPDLYAEVSKEKQQLEYHRDLSGLEKIKHDTFGKQKSAAKKKLAKIENAEKKLGDFTRRKKAFNMVKEDLGSRMEERREELKKRKEKAAEDGNHEVVKECQGALESFVKVGKDSAGERLDVMDLTSDYAMRSKRIQAEFLSRQAVRKSDGKMGGYDADVYFRDTARFCSPLNKTDEANVDEMLAVADATYVMRFGSHASAEYTRTERVKKKDMVDGKIVEVEADEKFQEKASLEDQRNAYELLMGKIDLFDVELKEIETKNPLLFKANPEVEDALVRYNLLNEMFKKLQVTVLTLIAMGKSDYVQGGNLTEEQLEKLNDRTRYISAMKDFTKSLVTYVKNYGQFIDGTYESKSDPLPVMAIGEKSLRDQYEENKTRLTVKVKKEAV